MSSKIIQLPPEIAEKIAAGEVVERPLSVVKELLENSIDAGATRIEIFLEEGGKKLIRIQDNGIGMNPTELRLALQRHATSKIKNLDELFSISTLGFRGEALPSIAAISKFKMQSRSREEEQQFAYEICVEGGKVIHEREVGHPLGTTIEISELFFNTPARLKFLKSSETEWGYIDELVTALALANPEIQWIVHHQNKERIRYTKSGLKDRMFEVWGKQVFEGFYPLLHEQSEYSVQGYIGHPNLSKSQAKGMYVFVNGRWVKDRLLNHAIATGYRNLLMQHQYPLVVLFFNLPPSEVDVNVHPTKREVRFVKTQFVHHFISEAIHSELVKAPWVSTSPENVRTFSSPTLGEGASPSSVGAGFSRPQMETNWKKENYDSLSKQQSELKHLTPLPTENALAFSPQGERGMEEAGQAGVLPFAPLKIIGQLKLTYILCESDNHLVLIDQHAAHERLGYEQIKSSYEKREMRSQNLLVPEQLYLKEFELELIRPYQEKFEEMGLVVEEFGKECLLVKAIPEVLGKMDVKKLIENILEDLKNFPQTRRLEEKLDHLFATMACHRQVRAGDKLNLEEMQALISQLDAEAVLYHCPHGRPLMVQVSYAEIEKWFKRVV